MTHQSFFSTREFVEALCEAKGFVYHPLPICVVGSGPSRTMYATASPAPYRSRYVSLAPFGLHASPGWDGELELSTLDNILRQLRGPQTRGFVWAVRFDHAALADGLSSFGIPCQHTSTHVLSLEHGYANVVSGYSATIRNQVRKALRRGVVVRRADSEPDIRAYYEVHARLVREKEWRGYQYPVDLFLLLNRLTESVRVLIAEYEERVVAGAVFFSDAPSVMYWHGASDREYSHLFASRAIFDEAIRWACETGAKSLDFGGSAGLSALEQFKASWGARPAMGWTFEWTNPLWARLSALKAHLAGQKSRQVQAGPYANPDMNPVHDSLPGTTSQGT